MAWADVLSSNKNKGSGSKRCIRCLYIFSIKNNKLGSGCAALLLTIRGTTALTGRLFLCFCCVRMVCLPSCVAAVTTIILSWLKALCDKVTAGIDAPVQFKRGSIGIEFASPQIPVAWVHSAFQTGGGLLMPRLTPTCPIVCGLVAGRMHKQRVFTHFDV